MKNSFCILPKTKLGKYAVVLIIVAIILVASINVLSMNSDKPADSTGFFGNLPLAVMALGAFSCAIISTITGFVAVYKNKERSALVYLCVLIGILSIYFGIAQIVGEITNSH
ncbi:MAG: hypothetical protein KA807_18665 [Prolixibacteraceae bacterium]|nr:hypothetical protein [Prolixibacteraceae bacterium]MBP9037103.1 hypothetical protein [Candidatus Cloacimonas sp.]HOT60252.1 hypothetical protein [Spirochaetales bacterium]HQK35093.1 hypothetical protein [Spirochaetales bacterium]